MLTWDRFLDHAGVLANVEAAGEPAATAWLGAVAQHSPHARGPAGLSAGLCRRCFFVALPAQTPPDAGSCGDGAESGDGGSCAAAAAAAGGVDALRCLLQRVVGRSAALVAAWMASGFTHGVMNTDVRRPTAEN